MHPNPGVGSERWSRAVRVGRGSSLGPACPAHLPMGPARWRLRSSHRHGRRRHCHRLSADDTRAGTLPACSGFPDSSAGPTTSRGLPLAQLEGRGPSQQRGQPALPPPVPPKAERGFTQPHLSRALPAPGPQCPRASHRQPHMIPRDQGQEPAHISKPALSGVIVTLPVSGHLAPAQPRDREQQQVQAGPRRAGVRA